jgi:hypothetical protein
MATRIMVAEATPPLEMALAWYQDNSSEVLSKFLSVVESS